MKDRILTHLIDLLGDLVDLKHHEVIKLDVIYTGDREGKQYAACIQERVATFGRSIILLRNKIDLIKGMN